MLLLEKNLKEFPCALALRPLAKDGLGEQLQRLVVAASSAGLGDELLLKGLWGVLYGWRGTFTSFAHFYCYLRLSKGVLPTSISNASIPIAQISLFVPLSYPFTYSGGRYSKVPTIYLWASVVLLRCAYPKSHNLTVPYMISSLHWQS